MSRLLANVNVNTVFNAFNTNIANVSVTGTATFRIGGGDDIIADPFVYFCDNTDGDGYTYILPFFKFQVRQ